MAKVIRHLRPEQKEFQKAFSALCDRRSAWQAWADFVECAAIEISNAVDHESEASRDRKVRYVQIMKTYTKAERDVFCNLFALMVKAMEVNPNQDFLGEMFMALELGNHWKGQFFTPYHLCEFMAKCTMQDVEAHIERRGWVGVMDPACGAGALLIAARNEFESKHFGYRQTLFVAQDIDHVAGLMCYIQLSLLGCAGYVVIADSFCNPVVGKTPLLSAIKQDQDFWFMPMFYDEIWQGRIKWEMVDLAMGKLSRESTSPVATAPAEPSAAEPSVTMAEAKRPAERQETAQVLNMDATGQLSFF